MRARPLPARRARRAAPAQAIRRPGTSAVGAHLEGPDDVYESLRQRPYAREDQQHVSLLDEELPARPERRDEHDHAADQADPPDRVRAPRHEGLDGPPEADQQEEEPE